MDSTFVTSSKGTVYVMARAKYYAGMLHYQIAGPTGNRTYGFAGECAAMPGISWAAPTLHSLASPEQVTYSPLSMRPETEPKQDFVRIRVKDLRWRVYAPELAAYLRLCLVSAPGGIPGAPENA
jgi:hypothetical protein